MDAVIVCDYNKGAITNVVVDRVLEYADSAVPVYVDTKGNPFNWAHPRVTVFPNRAEYNRYQSQYEWMANTVFKQSEMGASLLSYGKTVAHCNASSLNPRNVCGAGDSVIAAYVWAQLQGLDSPLGFAMEAAGHFVSLPINIRTLESVNALPANA
jgi:bifunctional ADP-heptose synthase (sugar kinase/adenylyltransferase)